MSIKNRSIIAWKQGVACDRCSCRFEWKDAAEEKTPEDRDPDGPAPGAPACPRCRRIIPASKFIVPRHHYLTVFMAAGNAHEKLVRKAAPCFVRGIHGGAIAAFDFPWMLSDKQCGDQIDLALIKAGFPEKCGNTWIRTAVWDEARQREGQDHEMILVHFDGKHLARTPATEWFTVVPEGMASE